MYILEIKPLVYFLQEQIGASQLEMKFSTSPIVLLYKKQPYSFLEELPKIHNVLSKKMRAE